MRTLFFAGVLLFGALPARAQTNPVSAGDQKGFVAPPSGKPPAYSFLDPIGDFVNDSILRPKTPFEVVPGKRSDWSFTLEPYLWAMGMSGDLSVKNLPSVHADFNAKTVLQHLDWGIMAHAEARKGRWGIIADGFFAQLSASVDPPGPLYESAHIVVQQGMAQLALAYRVIDDRRGFLDVYAGARYNYLGTTIDLSVDSQGVDGVGEAAAQRIFAETRALADNFLAGRIESRKADLESALRARVTSAFLERAADLPHGVRDFVRRQVILRALDATGNPVRNYVSALAEARIAAARQQLTQEIQGRLTRAEQRLAKAVSKRIKTALPTSPSGDDWWVDPLVGLRGQINLTRWLYLAAGGNVGGFGVGSNIAWQVTGVIGVNFTRNLFMETGYRYFYMDYENDGFTYNAAESGLIMGFGVRF